MSATDVEAPFSTLYGTSCEQPPSTTKSDYKKGNGIKCTTRTVVIINLSIAVAILCGAYGLFTYMVDKDPDQYEHSYGKRVMVFQSSQVVSGTKNYPTPKIIYTYKYSDRECEVTYYATVSKLYGIPNYGDPFTFYRYDTDRCSETVSGDPAGGFQSGGKGSEATVVTFGFLAFMILFFNVKHLLRFTDDPYGGYFCSPHSCRNLAVYIFISIAVATTYIVLVTLYPHPTLPFSDNPLIAECGGEIGLMNATARKFISPYGVETIFFDADGVWCPYDVDDGKYMNGTVYQILAYTSDPVCDFRNLQSNNTCGRTTRSSLAGKIKTF